MQPNFFAVIRGGVSPSVCPSWDKTQEMLATCSDGMFMPFDTVAECVNFLQDEGFETFWFVGTDHIAAGFEHVDFVPQPPRPRRVGSVTEVLFCAPDVSAWSPPTPPQRVFSPLISPVQSVRSVFQNFTRPQRSHTVAV